MMSGESQSPLVKHTYTVRFITPAFLGDAEQNGAWRTPPFKALLRQWWRVFVAQKFNYNHHLLRKAEGQLFGNAWLEPINSRSQFCQSRVFLRLDSWSQGDLVSSTWPGGQIESVITTRDGKGKVRADVYMGYGPIVPPSKKENRSIITIRNAINPADSNKLRICFKDNLKEDIMATLQLIQWFGALGSRSRNGWGSLMLEPANGSSLVLCSLPQPNNIVINQICRPWEQCLKEDWPHALGVDSDKPLIWITESKKDWRDVIGCLANIKIQVRIIAKDFKGPAGIGGIHLLGYPAGDKWQLSSLGKNSRLASQLRFKVLKTESGFIGLVFHLPCKFPDVLILEDKQRAWIDQNQFLVWEKIHRGLHGSQRLKPLF